MRTFVIAEAGSCHGGSLHRAKRLVQVAAEAGADAVKFQTFHAERLAARRHAEAFRAIYGRYAMPPDWLPVLAEAADEAAVEFMTTSYDVASLALVAPFVRRFKVASFEATDRDFLRAHVPYGKPVIVSTGLCSLDEVMELVAAFPPAWVASGTLTVLHAVSAYPTPLDQVNLGAIATLRGALGLRVGLSDHTGDVLTGALAVAAGASVIETHVRLDDTDPANPDFGHSLRPSHLARSVSWIRCAEAMMGDGIKQRQPCEAGNTRFRVQT